MKKVVLIIIISSFNAFSQIDNMSLMGIPIATNLTDITSLTSVNTGSVAYVNDQKSIYIYNGTNWIKILNNAPVITNETLVEDTNYIYVSVKINTNDWMVTRFHRSDINTETSAMGNGTQPTTLVAISALTYN